MLRTLIALILVTLFAGTALAVSLADSESRPRLDRRTGLVQAALALVSLLLGVWAWRRTNVDWLLGGGVLAGIALLLVLLSMRRAGRGAEETASGGGLPAIKTAIGLASVAAYLMAFVQP